MSSRRCIICGIEFKHLRELEECDNCGEYVCDDCEEQHEYGGHVFCSYQCVLEYLSE